MKNNPESGEFCCLHICLFNNGKAINFRTTLTPLRLLFLLFGKVPYRVIGLCKFSSITPLYESQRQEDKYNVRQ